MKNLLTLCLSAVLLFSCDTYTEEFLEELQLDQQAPGALGEDQDTAASPVLPEFEGFEQDALMVYNWVVTMQSESGLMESAEFTDFVSLYDNALAVILFSTTSEYQRAEYILDFFDARVNSELQQGFGGFYQVRTTDGSAARRVWMGDNAWLLIAINHYHARTGNQRYAVMAETLESWIRGLQEEDGSLKGGLEENGAEIVKVTEGMITAFYAVPGYDSFHKNLLKYLEENRYDDEDEIFLADRTGTDYDYALDLHSLSFLIFPDADDEMLKEADRFEASHKHSQNGEKISGYCFDVDQDVVWLEGSAQMGLAFLRAGEEGDMKKILKDLRKAYIPSVLSAGTKGLPYTANYGTNFGADYLWDHADLTPALSSSIWYLFLEAGRDPFLSAPKDIPEADRFW